MNDFKTKLEATFYPNNNLLLSIIIFISVSPLFENLEKIFFSTIVVFLLLIKRKFRFFFSIWNLFLLFLFAIVLILQGLILDLLYSKSLDFIGLGFWFSIFIGYIVCSTSTKEQLLYANEKLSFWSLVVGIPLFLVIQFNPSFVDLAWTYNYGGFIHRTFFLTNFHLTEDGLFSERFVGIGSEPGVTQIVLLLALWYRLKRVKKIDFRSLVIIIGIILGKSTAGFFTMILVLLLAIPFRKLIRVTIIFLPVIFYVIIDLWIYHTDNKLVGSLSFINRYGRYVDFFTGEIKNIFFGFGNAYYAQKIATADIGGWDSLLQVSQRYGVLFFLFLVAVLLINNRQTPIVAIIIIITFFSQLVWFYPAIATFYFWAGPKQTDLQRQNNNSDYFNSNLLH